MSLKFLDHPYAGRGKTILMYCSWCKRQHRVSPRPCPMCGVYTTLMPSDKVYDKCSSLYSCDGCDAYADHTNPF